MRCRRLLHERVVAPLGRPAARSSTANFSLDFKLKRFLRGRGRAPADVRHATWLGAVHTGRAGARCSTGETVDPFAEQRRVFAAAPATSRLERADLPVRDHVSAGRHPGQGRPREHGLRAARSAPRSSTSSSSSSSAACPCAPQAAALRDEAPAEAGDGADAAGGDRGPRRRRGSASRSRPGSSRSCASALQDELSPARLTAAGPLRSPSEVNRLVSEHLAGRRDHRKQLWTLLVFQLWYRRWVEERPRGRSAVELGRRRRCRGRCVKARPRRVMLVCPLSREPLRLESEDGGRGRDRAGSSATAAVVHWAIRDGIPRLVPPDLVAAAARHRLRVRVAVAALRRVPPRVRGRNSWTGSIPSTARSSRASASSTPAAAPAATRTCRPIRRPGGRRRSTSAAPSRPRG